MRIMKKIVAILAVAMLLCSALPMAVFAADTTIAFEMGANGAAGTHKDGSEASSYTETVGDYTLNITGGTKMYTGAIDLQGNSCLKLGTGKAAGGFTISDIPADVTSVIIYIGKYKANTSKLNINGTAYTLTNSSNDGAYDAIEVDTTTNKTITLTTVSGGYRAMVNSITYVIAAAGSADCDHASLECGETCPECGAYTKEHKYSNNCVAECENGCGTANPNYADHVYGGIYDAECDVCFAKREVNIPAADSELTILQAIDLGVGIGYNCYTEGKYYVTGEITEVYDTTYGNLYITDGENTFTVYGLYDGNGNRYDAMTEKPEAGMTITVYGSVGNFNGTAQIKNGDLTAMSGGCEHEYEYECATTCKLCGKGERDVVCVTDAQYACQDGLCIYCGNDVNAVEHAFDSIYDADCNYGCGYTREVPEAPVATEQTIDLFASTGVLAEDSSYIAWQSDNYQFANYKTSDSNAIRVSDTDHYRIYANSKVVVSGLNGEVLAQVKITATSEAYATVLGSCVAEGWEASVDGTVVTFTATTGAAALTIEKVSAQVRVNSVTITPAATGSEDCEHVYDNACDVDCNECGAVRVIEHAYVETIVDATCTAIGTKTYTCSVCGDSYSEEIPMIPHNYVDGTCSACGAELPLEATITFDADMTQRIEYSTESQKWEHDGLVLVNNKTDSSSDVGNYAGRFYKSSEIVISFPGMTSLTIDASGIGSDYLWDATLAGYTVTEADGIYTITFAEPTDSITLTAANQVRANSITASAVKAEEGCQHEYTYPCDQICCKCYELTNPDAAHSVKHAEAKAPTCAALGNIEYWYCEYCGAAWADEALTQVTNQMSVKLPATGEHTYDDEYDADCNVCGNVREVPEKPVEIVYGDANGDGAIDGLDEILLAQYIAEWDVELDLVAADANGDGAIDGLDEILLAQYIAEWEVTLGPSKTFNDAELGW